MGRIARLLQSKIDKFIENTVEAHFSQNQLVFQYDSSGVDAPALPEDRMVLVQVEGTGNYVSAGVLSVSQGANPGERIVYSRDKDGNVQSIVKMLNDGSISVNAPKGIAIETGDNANIEITCKGDLTVDASGKTVSIKSQKFSVNNGNLEVT